MIWNTLHKIEDKINEIINRTHFTIDNDYRFILGEPEIGEGTWIAPFTTIDATGGVKIGKHCTLGTCSQIYTHSSAKRTNSAYKYNKVDKKPVKIGDYVHISPQVCILMGVEIGDYSIIGAGTVILEDTKIPPHSMVVGNPARIIKD